MSHRERFPTAGLDELLTAVLADPGAAGRADRARVRAFLQHVGDAGVTCEGFGSRRAGQLSAAVVALRMPGRTALIMLATPGEFGIERSDQAAALDAALEFVGATELHFVQALVEPGASAKAELLQSAGFRGVTTLLYLERDVRFPWVDPPPPNAARWVAYAAETHSLFATVVSATYEASRDCPEVAGLRPIDDVLAGHRAAGRFDPGIWEIALIDESPAGCVLLSDVGDSLLEVVYMGVAPPFRGRGVGELLLRRALACARLRRRQRLTLVVDERNAPARRLYSRLNLATVATRVVFMRCAAQPC